MPSCAFDDVRDWSRSETHRLPVAARVGCAGQDATARIADDELHHAVVRAEGILHHVVTHASKVADGVVGHPDLYAQLSGAVDGSGISAGEAVPAGRFHGILRLVEYREVV